MLHDGLVEARPHGTLTLGRRPAEVERGRRFVADACRDYDGDVACTAMLLASELITNALRHGTGDISLLVLLGASKVRVEVADRSPEHPTVRVAGPNDENGRGLLILDHLADEWGVTTCSDGAGKSVWFTLQASPVG